MGEGAIGVIRVSGAAALAIVSPVLKSAPLEEFPSHALRRVAVEIALVDLGEALAGANAILGIEVDDAVLDRIFSTFCLGT